MATRFTSQSLTLSAADIDAFKARARAKYSAEQEEEADRAQTVRRGSQTGGIPGVIKVKVELPNGKKMKLSRFSNDTVLEVKGELWVLSRSLRSESPLDYVLAMDGVVLDEVRVLLRVPLARNFSCAYRALLGGDHSTSAGGQEQTRQQQEARAPADGGRR